MRILFHASCLICTAALLFGCRGGDPFEYVPVSGSVTYEDGSAIPIDGLVLTFTPVGGAIDKKTHPRPGIAKVDRATGAFAQASSRKFGDGLVRGKHKVSLTVFNQGMLPPSLVPAEYCDPEKTPLEVDADESPFHLKVRKP